jgi:hypothetical protein
MTPGKKKRRFYCEKGVKRFAGNGKMITFVTAITSTAKQDF